jgi:hypothetical protein
MMARRCPHDGLHHRVLWLLGVAVAVIVKHKHEGAIHGGTQSDPEPARVGGPNPPGNCHIEVCGGGSRVTIWLDSHAEIQRECGVLFAELDWSGYQCFVVFCGGWVHWEAEHQYYQPGGQAAWFQRFVHGWAAATRAQGRL